MVVLARAKEWRGIVPLHSTRADVEKQLGPPLPQFKTLNIYDMGEERVFINYSVGACEKGWPYGFNVPADTVTSIQIYLMGKVALSGLNLDLSKFKQVQDPHVGGILYYENNEEGFTVSVNKYEGEVRDYTYSPAAKDNYLQCPQEPSPLPENRGIADHLLIFDTFGDLSLAQEKKRLDNFARGLKDDADTEGYIIVYAGMRAYSGEAKARAKRAKDYVINRYSVQAGRVWAVDGGYQENRNVELYILPRGGPVPLVLPMVRPSKVQVIEAPKAKGRRGLDNR